MIELIIEELSLAVGSVERCRCCVHRSSAVVDQLTTRERAAISPTVTTINRVVLVTSSARSQTASLYLLVSGDLLSKGSYCWG